VSTLAGVAGSPGNIDGDGKHARFFQLQCVTQGEGVNLYVLDGNLLRKVTQSGAVTTLPDSALTDGAGHSIHPQP